MHCGSLQELPRHLIHRDAHTGNMLFEDTGFVGWVDFDHLETNFRIFDVCYCAAGILSARFTDTLWRNQWVLTVRKMMEAYGEIVSLVPQEVDAMWIAMVAIEALFVGVNARRDLEVAERNASICNWLFEHSSQERL